MLVLVLCMSGISFLLVAAQAQEKETTLVLMLVLMPASTPFSR